MLFQVQISTNELQMVKFSPIWGRIWLSLLQTTSCRYRSRPANGTVAAPFKPLGISVKARFIEGEQYPGGFGRLCRMRWTSPWRIVTVEDCDLSSPLLISEFEERSFLVTLCVCLSYWQKEACLGKGVAFSWKICSCECYNLVNKIDKPNSN